MLLLNKPLGLTPLEAIRQLQHQRPEYAHETISYAGRLDPMAQGLLLLLVGDENKTRHDYEAMQKTYEFEVLLGLSTDTYDILGLITNTSGKIMTNDKYPISNVKHEIDEMIGTQMQAFPPYSSKPVQGHPLYWWARAGRLDEIGIPEHEITVTSLSVLSQTSLPISDLKQTISQRISKVSGDFRQEEILTSWQDFFDSPTLPAGRQALSFFPLLSLQVTCSSGTYVRSIANSLGEKLGTGAVAYSITRIKVGDFSLQDALKLEPIA